MMKTIHLTAAMILAVASIGGCARAEETNGMERKTPADIAQAAGVALSHVESIHATGAPLGMDHALAVDLRVQKGRMSATGTSAGGPFEIIKVDENVYLKGDQTVWQALQAPPPVEGFAGHWVKLRSGHVSVDGALDTLVALVMDAAWQSGSTVGQATLNGGKVVTVSRPDGSRLYVANTGPAYPVRIEDKSARSQIEFSEPGVDFHITAPPDALSNALTTSETAWLDSVKKLIDTMNKVFANSPRRLTSASLATLADQVRGCGRELTRIGLPTARLRPVHTLVTQACSGYDKGAECFRTAADLGMITTATEKKFTDAIECGFASSEAGTTLTDAVVKGEEIKDQVS